MCMCVCVLPDKCVRVGGSGEGTIHIFGLIWFNPL